MYNVIEEANGETHKLKIGLNICKNIHDNSLKTAIDE